MVISDILFIIYLIIFGIICYLAFVPSGIQLQQEYLAWRKIKDYFTYKD